MARPTHIVLHRQFGSEEWVPFMIKASDIHAVLPPITGPVAEDQMVFQGNGRLDLKDGSQYYTVINETPEQVHALIEGKDAA